MEILKQLHPTARKNHTCMYCGCKIEAGEKYSRTTIKDDEVYDWVCHDDCDRLADMLDLYYCGEGVTDDDFQCAVNAYLGTCHIDQATGDFLPEVKNMSLIEKVRFIINDIENKKAK